MVPSSAKFCSQWCFYRNNNGSWNTPQNGANRSSQGEKMGRLDYIDCQHITNP